MEDQSKNQDSKLPTVNEICSKNNITVDELIRILRHQMLVNKHFNKLFIDAYQSELERLRVEEEFLSLQCRIRYHTLELKRLENLKTDK